MRLVLTSQATVTDDVIGRNCYFGPSKRAKYCLSVCLCLCPLTYLKTHVQISPHFLYMLPVAVARSCSDGNAIRCTSGFADDVIFSHNGANRPESKTTRMFRPFRQVAAPGTKLAVADCTVFQNSNLD